MIASYELLGEEVHKNVAVIPIKTPIIIVCLIGEYIKV